MREERYGGYHTEGEEGNVVYTFWVQSNNILYLRRLSFMLRVPMKGLAGPVNLSHLNLSHLFWLKNLLIIPD